MRDPLGVLEVWYDQYKVLRERESDPIGPQPIDPVLVADAIEEIRQLRTVIGFAARSVPAVALDYESVFCLRCRRIVHLWEWNEHQCEDAHG